MQSSFSLSFFFSSRNDTMPVNPYRTFPVWQQAVSWSFTFVLKTAGLGKIRLNWTLPSALLSTTQQHRPQGWEFRLYVAFAFRLGSWSTSWKLIVPWNLPVKRSLSLPLWQMCKLRRWEAHGGKEKTDGGVPTTTLRDGLSQVIPRKWTERDFFGWGLAGRDVRAT